MITEDQTEIVEYLGSPSTHGGTAVERIETHASMVFLAGPRVWKLKRAVHYDYLDFSTLDRRKAMCEAEVRINRRTAPALYRGVVAITRQPDGSLVLGGSGTPVEWVVEMERFDQDGLLDRLAERGALDLSVMRPLAAGIAGLHRIAEPRTDQGGAPGLAWVIDGNERGFAEQGAGILDPVVCARVTAAARLALAHHGALLNKRRDAGLVRQCHGDLHLRNIVLLDGRPTLFDGIEFNDQIACIDVLYDLAFVLMDLWRRRLPRHANALWNHYLAEMKDLEGLPLVPLFLSCRAAVRAKTSATAATLHSDPSRRGELQALARDYLAMADDLLRPPDPCLIAVGGLSGSGKSTLAVALGFCVGAPPGAVVIRSDEIRKRLCGVEPLVRLGPEGYTPEVSRRVYAAVAEQAAVVVRGGHAAIADAVFARAADRDAIERAASDAGVQCVGLWLAAPEATLVARAERRQHDPSDADAEVIRGQLAEDTGSIQWHRLDASASQEDVFREARLALGRVLGERMIRLESLP
jgi:aminoglycoside phosphotransferase family enzyme/predicted kinase